MNDLIFAFLLGALCGILMAALWRMIFHKTSGTLRIDMSDPTENPYMFLELPEENFAVIASGKTVELDVRTENYIPHDSQVL